MKETDERTTPRELFNKLNIAIEAKTLKIK